MTKPLAERVAALILKIEAAQMRFNALREDRNSWRRVARRVEEEKAKLEQENARLREAAQLVNVHVPSHHPACEELSPQWDSHGCDCGTWSFAMKALESALAPPPSGGQDGANG